MSLQDVELSHLRCFVAVGEELHYGRAAARLHMAQPPLTRQIQNLERRLDCRLLERTSRSTRLTPAGAQLLEAARALLAQTGQALEGVQSLGRGERGRVAVAAAPSLMLDKLPRVIRAYRKQFPDVEFVLHEMASSAIMQSIRTGSADLGFVRGLDKDRDVKTWLHWKEPLVGFVAKGYRFKRSGAGLEQLRGKAFVFFPRLLGPAFYDEVARCCRRAGFVLRVSQEARQWSSILGLVSAGMGVSVGPRSVAGLLPGAVRCVPLPGMETTVRIAGSRSLEANPAAFRFLQLAEREFGL